MRTLLLFIFIFGALGFTKCQNTNQALNSRSTLADSATYFGGVLSAEGQFRYLETLGADENTFKKKLFLEGAKWALSCDLPDDYNGYDVYGSLLLNSYLHELEKPDERMYAKDRKILIDSSSYAWGVTAVLYNRAILDARGLNKDLFFSGIQVGLDREFNHLERLKEITVVEQYMQSLPEKIVKLEASKLDANSTLADSGSYYLGVWEMNQVLEKTAGIVIRIFFY